METDFLMFKVGHRLLIYLYKGSGTNRASAIHKRINITYAYLARIIKKLIDAGLIERQGHKYKTILVLTKKGYKIARSLKIIENAFERL